MQITEVRIKLMDGIDPAATPANGRLKAFCSIEIDGCFVVRDLKVIEGVHGFFVAMPSRKLADRCPRCGTKNPLLARCCNQCGRGLDAGRATRGTEGKAKLHADIAHPINQECRTLIQDAVREAYAEERRLAALPGYVSRYDPADLGDDDGAAEGQAQAAPLGERVKRSA